MPVPAPKNGQTDRKGLRDDAQEEALAKKRKNPSPSLPAGPRARSQAGKPRSEQDDHHNAKMAKPPNPSQIRVVIIIIAVFKVPRGVRGQG